MERLYELLGVNKNATDEEIEKAYNDKLTELYIRKNMGAITRDQFNKAFDELNYAYENVGQDEPDYGYDDNDLDDKEKPRKRSGKGKKLIGAAVAVAVCVSIIAGAYALGKRHTESNAGSVTYESSETDTPEEYEQTPEETPNTPEGSSEQSDEQTVEDEEKNIPPVVHYADINDETVVRQRAASLVEELKEANIINPTTGSLYTEDEIFTLIKYSWGLYTPETMEEIDVLHLNLLNLLISPLNTDEYLYQVVYASGNDDFKDMAGTGFKVKPNFATTFAEYEENGVYPLTQWMQQKREAIYSTTNREEIEKIYTEVGQVMADIMKGNGCTITIYEDKQEYTYTYTSEQILANHASAMLLTIDAQLIFANHYELRDAQGKVVEAGPTVWQVYNKFNGDEPDQVSLDEIQAWINNGCDYEWGIEDVLIDGQTFGQRIQGDMEGMAQNNYAMSKGQTLTK